MNLEERGQFSTMESAIAGILAPAANDPKAMKVLDEDVFDRIAKTLLQHALQGWSTIPHTYAILHNIGSGQYASLFIDDDLKDAAIPPSRTSLPPGLSDDVRNKFIEGQHIALTVKPSFGRIRQGRHVHVHVFSDSRLEERGDLGKGGQAYVKEKSSMKSPVEITPQSWSSVTIQFLRRQQRSSNPKQSLLLHGR